MNKNAPLNYQSQLTAPIATMAELPCEVDNLARKLTINFGHGVSEYALRTLDGVLVAVTRSFWEASRTLKEHSATGKKMFQVHVTKDTVFDLLNAYEQDSITCGHKQIYDLFSVTLQLKLDGLMLKLLHHYIAKGYMTLDIPKRCRSEAVLSFWGLLCQFAPRQERVYEAQLQRLHKFRRGEKNFMVDACNILQERLGRYAALGVGCLPCGFEVRRMAAAICGPEGKRKTVVFLDNTWIEVDIFGRHFDINTIGFNEAYLQYGSYVLYRDGSSVYLKYLTDATAPVKMVGSYEQLLVRGDHVFALTLKETVERRDSKRLVGRRVAYWSEGQFVDVLHSLNFDGRIDFLPKEMVFCAPAYCSAIDFWRLQGEKLIPIGEIVSPKPTVFFYYEGHLYVKCASGISKYHVSNDSGIGDSSFADITLPKERHRAIEVYGGRLFANTHQGFKVYLEDRWELFPGVKNVFEVFLPMPEI